MNISFKAYNIANYLYMQYMPLEANYQSKESLSTAEIDGSDSYSLVKYIHDEIVKSKKCNFDWCLNILSCIKSRR